MNNIYLNRFCAVIKNTSLLLRKSYINKRGILRMAFIHKINNDYFLRKKIKVNGKWKDTIINNFGKDKPTIWQPQLINDKAETILAKLPDESIDLIITDPPYGIDFKGGRYLNRNFDEIFNDDSLDFLKGIGKEFKRILKPNTHCYIFTRWDAYPVMADFFMKELELDTVLVWDKDEGGHGMGDLSDYAPRYEMIMKFSKGRRALNGKRHPNIIRQQDIRFTNELKVHPTQKPRALMEFLIEKSSNSGETIADFYGGSYSVARAAMRLFRKSICVELNPTTHRAAESLVKKDLHNDPVYNIDWAKTTNIQICDTKIIG
jgi:site-specific DNA-methyltransferase (adenine-specific)